MRKIKIIIKQIEEKEPVGNELRRDRVVIVRGGGTNAGTRHRSRSEPKTLLVAEAVVRRNRGPRQRNPSAVVPVPIDGVAEFLAFPRRRRIPRDEELVETLVLLLPLLPAAANVNWRSHQIEYEGATWLLLIFLLLMLLLLVLTGLLTPPRRHSRTTILEH